MFLSVHNIVALTSIKYVYNPWLLFLVNFGLHYFLDAIPHGDGDEIKKGFKNKNLNYLTLATLDFVFVIIMNFIFYINNKIPVENIILASLGAILPDILWGFYSVTKFKFLKWADNLNLWAHQIIKYKPHYIFEYSFQLIPIFIYYLLLK